MPLLNKPARNSGLGIGMKAKFCPLAGLTIIFAAVTLLPALTMSALKLGGIIDWSWLFITSPCWLTILAVAMILTVLRVLYAIFDK